MSRAASTPSFVDLLASSSSSDDDDEHNGHRSTDVAHSDINQAGKNDAMFAASGVEAVESRVTGAMASASALPIKKKKRAPTTTATNDDAAPPPVFHKRHKKESSKEEEDVQEQQVISMHSSSSSNVNNKPTENKKYATEPTAAVPRDKENNNKRANNGGPVVDAAAAAAAATDTYDARADNNKQPKKKKLTFQDQVYQTLFTAFAPFTVKTLAQRLDTTEAAVNFTLLSLKDKNLVCQKDFASKKSDRVKTLWWANHEVKCKEVPGMELASTIDQQQARSMLQHVQAQHARMQHAVATLTHELSTADVTAQLQLAEHQWQALQAQVAAVQARIIMAQPQQQPPPPSPAAAAAAAAPAQMRRGGVSSLLLSSSSSSSSPRDVKRRINHMRDEWQRRKAQCTDVVDQIADGMEKKPKQVLELLDIETDEMVGATMPAKYDV